MGRGLNSDGVAGSFFGTDAAMRRGGTRRVPSELTRRRREGMTRQTSHGGEVIEGAWLEVSSSL